MITTLLLVCLTALASQRSFEVDQGRHSWDFDVQWTDDDGVAHRARFSLPAEAVLEDLSKPFRYDNAAAARFAARAVNEASYDDARVRATAVDNTVKTSAIGQSRRAIEAALDKAARIRDEAWDRAVVEAGYMRLDDGTISPDYARQAAEYAGAVSTIVTALGGPGESPRGFADLALSFVQSIPYEATGLGQDRYRRPLSLLGQNVGDCDSKTVLFLALMTSAWPRVDTAVILLPGHVLAALKLEDRDGADVIRIGSEDWEGAEPVGPALTRVGDIKEKTRRKIARKATIRRVRPLGPE